MSRSVFWSARNVVEELGWCMREEMSWYLDGNSRKSASCITRTWHCAPRFDSIAVVPIIGDRTNAASETWEWEAMLFAHKKENMLMNQSTISLIRKEMRMRVRACTIHRASRLQLDPYFSDSRRDSPLHIPDKLSRCRDHLVYAGDNTQV